MAGESVGNLLVLFQLGQIHRSNGISWVSWMKERSDICKLKRQGRRRLQASGRAAYLKGAGLAPPWPLHRRLKEEQCTCSPYWREQTARAQRRSPIRIGEGRICLNTFLVPFKHFCWPPCLCDVSITWHLTQCSILEESHILNGKCVPTRSNTVLLVYG